MRDDQIEGLMAATVRDLPADVPRVAEVLTAGRRRRRLRVLATTAGSVAVVLAVVGVLGGLSGRFGNDAGPAALPTPQGKWIGFGHVAVNLPDDWTDDSPCSSSAPGNTWAVLSEALYQERVFHVCEEAESYIDAGLHVTLRPDYAGEKQESEVVVEVDGHQVLRAPTECYDAADPENVHCVAELRFPGDVVVVVSGRGVDAEVAMDAVLERVRWLDDVVGVPSTHHELVDHAREQLQRYGFEVETSGSYSTGECSQVVSVDPAPGTLLPLGSRVKLTVEPVTYPSDCRTGSDALDD